MTSTHSTRTTRPAQGSAQIATYINNYESKLLTTGQKAVMLADIKAVALATRQPTRESASNLLSTLCRFVVDLAPSAGCPLSEVLTEVQVARWASRKRAQPQVSRTLTTSIGRLRQALRAQTGLPPRLKTEVRRKVGVPPLSADQYLALRDAALTGPEPIARAFAAAFGAGLPGGGADGARFETREGRVVLVLPTGATRAVLAETVSHRLVGATVDRSDWEALVDVAARDLRCRVDVPVAHQSFRERAFAQPCSVADTIHMFDLRVANIDALIDFMAPVDIASNIEAQAVLRG